MAQYKQATHRKMSATEVALRLYAAQSPEVQASLDWLRKRYGKYAMPAAELRKMLDKQLGDRSLTEELYKMREE